MIERARSFIFDKCWAALLEDQSRGTFGMIVAGYCSGASLSETWKFTIEGGVANLPQQVIAPGESNAFVGGDPEAFVRVFSGHSMKLSEFLTKRGFAVDLANQFITDYGLYVCEYLIEAPMPIQDTIDLAEFIVSLSSGFARFKRGSQTIGGPIESVAITKHEGLKWIKRKHYFNSVLNPEEREHEE